MTPKRNSKIPGRLRWLLVGLAILILCTQAVAAGDAKRGTKEDAVAMVTKAIMYLKTNGPEKAFAAFSDPKGAFIDRDIYVYVYNNQGVCLASGTNPKLVGKNRLDEQDADGKYINKERIEWMKTQKSFWQSYKWSDPLTHKIRPKLAYCEVTNDAALKDVLICSGVYDAGP